MIKCPGCEEMIDENLTECPFCKTSIPEDLRKQVLEENEAAHQEAVEATIDEYDKRIRYGIITAVIMIIIAVSGMTAIYAVGLNFVWSIALFITLILIYGICVFKLRIGLCPYCESFMGGSFLFRSHCPRCGGRLIR